MNQSQYMSWTDNERELSDIDYNPNFTFGLSIKTSFRTDCLFEKQLDDSKINIGIMVLDNEMIVLYNHDCYWGCCGKVFYEGEFSIERIKMIEFSFQINHYVDKINTLFEKYELDKH